MLYRILLILALAAFTIDCNAQSLYLFSYFKENGEDGLHMAASKDGYVWTALRNDSSFLAPAVGKDKLMRDPCIIQAPDGTFHMVWTTGWNDKGIGYAYSADLINWSEQKFIPVMEHEPGARNCWAPEIFYDGTSGRYVIFWATTITGKFPETQQQQENAYNHRIYCTTTTDFKHFSPAALMYNPGFNVIDATIQQSGGDYIMFLKDETIEPPQKNIRIATSKNVLNGYSKPNKPITGKYWAEGPTCIRIENKWLVYFDKYTQHQMGAVASTDLLNWEDVSEKVSFPNGTRHGTVLKVSKEVFDKIR